MKKVTYFKAILTTKVYVKVKEFGSILASLMFLVLLLTYTLTLSSMVHKFVSIAMDLNGFLCGIKANLFLIKVLLKESGESLLD